MVCRRRRSPGSWCRKQAHDLVVSTYGRGFYIMSDITPLEQGLMEPSRTEPVTLAAPRPVYREFTRRHAPGSLIC